MEPTERRNLIFHETKPIEMKDLFSTQSDQYARYRPSYPTELIDFILDLVPEKLTAWDCGAGSGQITQPLAPHFQEIIATDISELQLQMAPKLSNVSYLVQPAESTTIKSNSIDLIIVAQAIHWFNFEQFYKEAKRVLKPNGVMVVTGYGLVRVNDPINEVIDQFYSSIQNYWEPERKYIDEHYQTIPFPFNEINAPSFHFQVEWQLDHFIQYINTWSAIKYMKSQIMEDPTRQLYDQLLPLWNSEITATFPTLLRVGYVN